MSSFFSFTIYKAHGKVTGTRGSFPVGKAAGALSWPLTSI